MRAPCETEETDPQKGTGVPETDAPHAATDERATAADAALPLALPGPSDSPLDAVKMYRDAGFHPIPLCVPTTSSGHETCDTDWHNRNPKTKAPEPCAKPGKRPRLGKWSERAVSEPEKIDQIFRHNPDANVGLAMGGPADHAALDVDGEVGFASLAELVAKHGPLPRTMHQRTGSGSGEQYVYRAGPDQDLALIKNRAGQMAPGLDVRAQGGQIAVAPSLHKSGRRYEWLDCTPPAELPPWLYREMVGEPKAKASKAASTPTVKTARAPRESRADSTNSHRFQAYYEATLRDLCAEIASTPKGGRNNALRDRALRAFRTAMLAGLDPNDAWDDLTDAAAASGLDPSEYEPLLERSRDKAIAEGPAVEPVDRAPPQSSHTARARSARTGDAAPHPPRSAAGQGGEGGGSQKSAPGGAAEAPPERDDRSGDPLDFLEDRLKLDPLAAFAPEVLAAASALSLDDPAAFARLYESVKRHGAQAGDWKKRVADAAKRLRQDRREAAARAAGAERAARQQARTARPVDGVDHRRESERYAMRPGALERMWIDEHGAPRSEPLAEFSAVITREIVETDGVEETRVYEIEALVAGARRTITVPAADYPRMEWVQVQLGAGATLMAGALTKDHARAAFQHLSQPIPLEHRYTFTGWHREAGGWLYLHGNGAIGGDATVVLPASLANYALPPPLAGEPLRAALGRCLDLLVMKPHPFMVPMFASAWRAPLGDHHGTTYGASEPNRGKTLIATLVLQHFGAGFTERNPPATFSSTVLGINHLRARASGVVFLVDDLVFKGTSNDEKASEKVDAMTRTQFGGAGRAKLTKDSKLLEERAVRGTLLMTGEVVPPGFSLRSRMLVADLEHRVPVDLDPYKAAGARGELAGAMAAFITDLRPRYDAVRATLPARRAALKAKYKAITGDDRTSGEVADLALGPEALLEWGARIGAFTAERVAVAQRIIDDALVALAKAQLLQQGEQDPVRRFLSLLRTAFLSGDCHAVGAGDTQPLSRPDMWGWELLKEERVLLDDDGEPVMRDGKPVKFPAEYRRKGPRVGFLLNQAGGEHEPQIAFQAKKALEIAKELADASGEPLPLTERVLSQRLYERRLLARTELESQETLTVRVSFDGQKHRGFLCMKVRHFLADGSDDEP